MRLTHPLRAVPMATLLLGLVAGPFTPAVAFGPDPATAAARFRFVVFNDAHLSMEDLGVSRARLHAAVDEINALVPQIDFVLVAGDLAQSTGNPSALQTELQAAYDELQRLVIPYHVTLGNRDVTETGDDSAWRSHFGATSYRFVHKGMQFICLRTAQTPSSTAIPAVGLDSLAVCLGQISTNDPLVVFAHHPLGPLTPLRVTNVDQFYARVDLFALRGVFCGQWCGIFEEQRGAAWYCTSPALSVHRANDDDSAEKGYRLVTVLPDYSLASRFYPLGQPPNFAPEPPALAATGNRYAIPGRLLRLQVQARDPDGDIVTYSAAGLPAGATFNAAQRLFSWIPTTSQVGVYKNVRFFASDVSGKDTLGVAIRVLGDGCLFEDFQSQSSQWTASSGTWSITNGELRQTDATTGAFFDVASPVWGDVHLEADLLQDSGDGYAGLVWRYQDAANNYYLWTDGARIQLRRRVGNAVTRLGPSATVGAISGWHHARVEAVGANLKVYWDGTLQLEANDATFATGRVGAVCSKAAARFDNFVAAGCAGLPNHAPVLQPIGDRTLFVGRPYALVVTATEPDAGTTLRYSAMNLPPGALFDWRNRRFTWTPSTGQAKSWYAVRFGVTDGELDDAESVTLTVLDTTGACFHDGYDTAPGGDGIATSTNATPSLVTFTPPSHANFTLQARVRVSGSGTGGLAFRIADPTHYYYLDASRSDDIVDLRKQNGTVSTLLAGGAGVRSDINEWHPYRIEATGPRLRVFIEDVLVYDFVDAGSPTSPVYLAGRSGVQARNATLHVDDVLLTGCSDHAVDVHHSPSAPLADLIAIPNPFNPRTTVRFSTAAPGLVRARIYDCAGRLVRTLWDGALPAGTHRLEWKGEDAMGREVPSGVYFVRVATGGTTRSQRLVLLK